MLKNRIKTEPTERINWGVWEILALFAPVIIAVALQVFYGFKTGNFAFPWIKWNDEAAYYELVKTYLTKGFPHGYWGFDGNHAILGTGSAWSPAILLPYIISGFLFSWNYYHIFITNIILMFVANFMFIFLTGMKRNQCRYMAILQLSSTVLILYMSTNMSEPYRFALAIVLAGVLYKLFFQDNSKLFKYCVAPIFILYIIQVYTFFAFCIPLYIFAVMKESILWKKLLASAAAMLGGAGASYYVLHLISSNYNIFKTEALLLALKQADFIGALKAFLGMFKEGAYGVIGMFELYFNNALFLWYLTFCALLVFVAMVLLIISNSKKNTVKTAEAEIKVTEKDTIIACIVIYSVILFFFMYMTVYSIEKFTFLRGTFIVALFSMQLLILVDRKWIAWFIIAIQAVGLIALPFNLQYFMEGRYISTEEKKVFEAQQTEFMDYFVLTDSKDPWDNTIAIYTLEPKVIASIPAGFGVNMMRNQDAFPTQAGYLLFSAKTNKEELNSEWLETYYPDIVKEHKEELEQNYEVIHEDEKYVIYKRK